MNDDELENNVGRASPDFCWQQRTSSREDSGFQWERLATTGREGRICSTQAYCNEAIDGRALTIADLIKPLGKDGSRPKD